VCAGRKNSPDVGSTPSDVAKRVPLFIIGFGCAVPAAIDALIWLCDGRKNSPDVGSTPSDVATRVNLSVEGFGCAVPAAIGTRTVRIKTYMPRAKIVVGTV